ncbi:MAG: SurA N-terminal domain-containing protein [bacterium]|nr:SurA N-terminal domain-containing protein [bacterium]
MLSLIRNNVQSFFIKAIVVMVAVVMLFFGISSYQDQGVNTLADVGDIEVKYEQYSRAYDQATEQIRSSYGANADQLIQAMNLKGQVLSRLVNSALLVKAAEKAGLAVTDKELAERLSEISIFLTDQRFDQAKYQEFLKNSGYSAAEFEGTLRREILANKLMALVNSGHSVSRAYVETVYQRDQTAYQALVLPVEPADLKISAQPTAAEIKKYYDDHTEQFQAPARFQIEYFTYGLAQIKDEITVSDQAAALYYKQKKGSQFTTKPSYHSRHILIALPEQDNAQAASAARSKAQELYSQLQKNPKSFEALAKKFSQDPGSAQRGGDLGWSEEGHMVGPFEKQALALKPGEISAPFLTQFGYHIVELIEKRGAQQRPFEEVQAEIVAQIRTDKAQRRLENWKAKAEGELSKKGLATLAESIKQSPQTSDFFDERGNLASFGNAAPVYAAIEEKKSGDSGVLSLNDQLLVYQIKDVKAPQTKSFEEVAVEAELLATSAKEKELTQAKLAEMEQQITSVEAFNALAQSLNKKQQSIRFLYKDRQIQGLRVGRDFQQALSHFEAGEVGFLSQGNRGYAVHLISKTPGAVDTDPRGLMALERELQQQKTQILLSGLVEELRKELEVRYNNQLLQQLEISTGG